MGRRWPGSGNEEGFPVADAEGIADEGGSGEVAWRGRGAEELQTCFVGSAVAFALVDAFAGEHAVFP